MPRKPLRKRLDHRKKSSKLPKNPKQTTTKTEAGQNEDNQSKTSVNVPIDIQAGKSSKDIMVFADNIQSEEPIEDKKPAPDTIQCAQSEESPENVVITPDSFRTEESLEKLVVQVVKVDDTSHEECKNVDPDAMKFTVWSYGKDVTSNVETSPLKLWRSGQVPGGPMVTLKVHQKENTDSDCNLPRISLSPVSERVVPPTLDNDVTTEVHNSVLTWRKSNDEDDTQVISFTPDVDPVSPPALGYNVTGDHDIPLTEGNNDAECDASRIFCTLVADPAPRSALGYVSESCEPVNPITDLPSRLMANLMRRIPKQWGVRVSDGGAYAMLFSLGIQCAVQRVVYTAFDGSEIRFVVHNQILPTSHEVHSNRLLKSPVRLSEETFEDFVSSVLSALQAVQDYNMCVALDSPNFVEAWSKHPNCRLDENSFLESGYERTLRTVGCKLLVGTRKKRCEPCSRYLDTLNKREARRSDEAKPPKRHNILTPTRLKKVLDTRKKTVRNQVTKIKYQAGRIAKLLETESQPIDQELHEELTSVLDNATTPSELAKIFWEDQKKAHAVKDPRGMRWHPFILRYALHLKSLSSTTYQAMRDSGFIKLPSERTLFEYSHPNPTKEGVQTHVVERISKIVREFDDDFKKYHVLMFDEMYVFKNVVYHKGTGEVVGYMTLDEIEQELLDLQKALDGEDKKDNQAPLATTMLTYLVKGVANDVKGVVASFTASGLNVDQLDSRTWDVIWNLEMAGLKVIALVADGSAINHALFQRHPPYTNSEVVFDTLNIYAVEERPIFFFNDTPHLLKTIRNCFANSGAHKKTRLMRKNNEIITWQTIIGIFKKEQDNDLRYCHKLSNLHVHLNSYSVMKVYVAAQVLSRTVAAYIEQCKIPGTSETIKFIRLVNDWFDCLNGAHSQQAVRTRNKLLARYEDENDPRFQTLMDFLAYVKDWEKELNELKIDDTEKSKRQLSSQSKIGIERTVRSFVGATKFLFKTRKYPGKGFIMARVFQQDPLAHYYSHQRVCRGGSTHPTVAKYLENQNILDVKRSLGLKRQRGNTQPLEERIDPNEPLPKRSQPVQRKLQMD